MLLDIVQVRRILGITVLQCLTSDGVSGYIAVRAHVHPLTPESVCEFVRRWGHNRDLVRTKARRFV